MRAAYWTPGVRLDLAEEFECCGRADRPGACRHCEVEFGEENAVRGEAGVLAGGNSAECRPAEGRRRAGRRRERPGRGGSSGRGGATLRAEPVWRRSRAASVRDARHAGQRPASRAAPRLMAAAKRKMTAPASRWTAGGNRVRNHIDQQRGPAASRGSHRRQAADAEQQSFGEDLGDEAGASCAEGVAHREFVQAPADARDDQSAMLTPQSSIIRPQRASRASRGFAESETKPGTGRCVRTRHRVGSPEKKPRLRNCARGPLLR